MKYIGLFIKSFLRFLLKPLSFVPAICMMYLIFSFSAQSGAQSSAISYKVSSIIVEIGDSVLQKEMTAYEKSVKAEQIHFYVRKCAHFTIYFLLAISVAFPLYVYGMRGIWLMLFAGAFCVGFACLDEYHQSFVSGRTAAKRDIIIDSCGAILGIIVTRMFGFIGRKTIFAPLSKRKDKD